MSRKLEFLLYDEEAPYCFDKGAWSLFSMGGADESTWLEIENPDTAFRIEANSRIISEWEARSLAEARKREFEEG
ncbi:MAG: hypothetical protein K9M96_07895 [Deltaproteobacteria bacterium]|nr:hypothetical protein [Deltaproteobacteria bacterium]